MASVRAAKRSAVEHLEFSELLEPGVVGAALLAGQASGARPLRTEGIRIAPPDPIPVSSGGNP